MCCRDHGGPVSILATQRGRARHQRIRLEELDVAPNLVGLDQTLWCRFCCCLELPGSSEREIMSTQFSWKIKRSMEKRVPAAARDGAPNGTERRSSQETLKI